MSSLIGPFTWLPSSDLASDWMPLSFESGELISKPNLIYKICNNNLKFKIHLKLFCTSIEMWKRMINIQDILSENIKFTRGKVFGKFFWSVSQQVQIKYIFTDDIPILWLSFNFKKQETNFTNKSKGFSITSMLPYLTNHTTWIWYQKSFIRSMT